MNVSEAKKSFVLRWGEMCTNWGVSKTKGQIHALLLLSSKPKCSDHIMEELGISRGNACMSLKSLLEWGLIYKRCVEGCRKEYYVAEKDMYRVFRQIVIHRRKQELEPLIQMVHEYDTLEADCPESEEFCQVVKDIKHFSVKADATLESIINTNPKWFIGTFMKMFR